jgi:anti-sigma B factor antagonist
MEVADVKPPWPDAELAASRDDAELVISVSGDVDLATAPSVEREMAELMAEVGVEEVVIDLSRVGFLDSAGVRVLVLAKRAAAARDLPLRVQSPSSQCRRILEVAGLTELFGLDDPPRAQD